MIPTRSPQPATTGPRYLFWRYVAVSVDGFLAVLLTMVFLMLLGIGLGDLGDPGQVWLRFLSAALQIAVMILASAAFLARTGAHTPGKAMAGLRVAGLNGFRAALLREALRWLPLSAVLAAGEVLKTRGAPSAGLVAGFVIAMVIALPGYYVLPIFALDGDYRARWDKVVGSRVERYRA